MHAMINEMRKEIRLVRHRNGTGNVSTNKCVYLWTSHACEREEDKGATIRKPGGEKEMEMEGGPEGRDELENHKLTTYKHQADAFRIGQSMRTSQVVGES